MCIGIPVDAVRVWRRISRCVRALVGRTSTVVANGISRALKTISLRRTRLVIGPNSWRRVGKWLNMMRIKSEAIVVWNL